MEGLLFIINNNCSYGHYLDIMLRVCVQIGYLSSAFVGEESDTSHE